ncbi:MAG: hypothetical protein LBS64_06080 [Spirochaetaceae bacterium]|jgi:hypothetical protein|nr:hypothetical protein [Spirochaetaceae bacterium]
MPVLFCFSFFILVLLTGCKGQQTVSVFRPERLFSINYGSFEDEINLFSLGGVGEINTQLVMREGLFYLTNGEAQKVMQLNSYGDLLAFYYNPDTNAPPAFEIAQEEAGTVATQWALRYPFSRPGKTAVDSRKYLYVVDNVPPERQERDSVNRLLLSQVVLRFSTDGTFLDYIGQQGPGDIPFPFIKDIYVTANNELVVVCQANAGMLVYWYAPDGFLLYRIPINNADLPNSPEKISDHEVYRNLEKIVPNFSQKLLYLNINYYSNSVDEVSKVQFGTDYRQTLIYTFDIESREYTRPLTIPPFEQTLSGNNRAGTYLLPYDLLGLTSSGWFYFILADETGYMLQMVHSGDQRLIKRRLAVNTQELWYYSFFLSPDGIISALLAGEKSADVVWWRLDTLISG